MLQASGGDLYGKVLEIEKNSTRKCFENNDFVAFCPYASRFPFEVWIFPKENLQQLYQCNYKALAEILGKVLKKLKELNAAYNFTLNYAPKGEHLRFHIEVLPRLATWAGFEMFGTVINSEPPEEAAKFYRGES